MKATAKLELNCWPKRVNICAEQPRRMLFLLLARAQRQLQYWRGPVGCAARQLRLPLPQKALALSGRISRLGAVPNLLNWRRAVIKFDYPTRRISECKIASLRSLYENGERINKAAVDTDVDPRTAAGYYKAFAAAGVRRGRVQPPRRPNHYKLPAYDGPDWIG
jgi:hypothetical protein